MKFDRHDPFRMIDNERLLILDSRTLHLFLLKIDFVAWKMDILDAAGVSFNRQRGGRLVMDSVEQNKFIVYDLCGFTWTGGVVDGKRIILKDVNQLDFSNLNLGGLKCEKLEAAN
jgi:hypothetical protein